MKAGDQAQTYPFTIRMDPNLKGVTEADLKEQFELAQKIVEKTSAANEAVIRIREMRDHLVSNRDKIPSRSYEHTITPFLKQIGAVEEELYQVRNQSNQDPLNFPIKLNNRLASLRRSLENGDAKPTDGAYKVFGELSAELDKHLGELNGIIQRELPGVNRLLKKEGSEGLNPGK
jgi:hypothetical protein